MIDKTVPHIGVLMIKTDLDIYPRFTLPDGYIISGYKPGFENDWAKLMFEAGLTESLNEAEKIFRDEFLSIPELLPEQCLFVLDASGGIAAAASVWPGGKHFGRELLRIHWVACAEEHQGKGLVKVLLTSLLDIVSGLGYRDILYLTSQTWSYKALGLYSRFGFVPYKGEKPVNWKAENFEQETKAAWTLIDEKIEEYKKK